MKKENQKRHQGITLIALVIAIIVLLILAGVTISTLTGENRILGKSKTAKEETQEKTATEIINLKITNAQIKSYSEEQQMPNLQYLADRLYEDNEIEYIYNESQKMASKEKIKVTGKYIYTKLEEYPYEFQIDSKLRLASIDGVEIADSSKNENYEDLKEEIENLKNELQTLSKEKSKVLWENTAPNEQFIAQTITLNDNINNYKFYEVVFKYAENENTNSNKASTGLIPVTDLCTLSIGLWYQCFREITNIQENQMTFGTGFYRGTYGNSARANGDVHIRPYKVIGFKY